MVDHELVPGSRTTYFMTGPEGEKYAGYWEVTAVDERDPSNSNGFADGDFNPNPDLPVAKNVYAFAEHNGGTRASYVGTFATAEDLQGIGYGRHRRHFAGDWPDRRAGCSVSGVGRV